MNFQSFISFHRKFIHNQQAMINKVAFLCFSPKIRSSFLETPIFEYLMGTLQLGQVSFFFLHVYRHLLW